MCGIAGIVDTSRHPVTGTLQPLLDALRHRGPDGEGTALDGAAGLAHSRLAVIDPRAGRQPMTSPDGNLTLVFNGEIYNYRELRKELGDHPFSTKSDSEVLLAAFRKWGPECLEKLNGIFAFAVWVRDRQKLFLARDPYGVKPLYYSLEGGAFCFASEVKAILAARGTRPRLDRQALADLLTYRYNPSPRTLFDGIRKLRPGFFAWADGKGMEETRWYSPPERAEENDEAILTGRAASLVESGIKRQLVADVPVAVLLSGGVDSSLVATIAARHYGSDLTAYTAGFEGTPGMDERQYAGKLCEHMGIKHRTVETAPGDFIDTLEDMVWHLEEPSATTSAVPLFLLCKEVGKNHKVALSGQGADELFAGYKRHMAVGLSGMVQPVFRSETLKKLVNMVGTAELRRAFYALGEKDPAGLLLKTFSLFNREQREAVLKEALPPDITPITRNLKDTAGMDMLNKMLYVEMRTSLSDDLLAYTDKTAMASGVEVRVPLLDIPLARFAEGLPSGMKLNGLKRKYLFKKTAERFLPPEILNRPKLGFDTPLENWLRSGLADRAREICVDTGGMGAKIFNLEQVEKLFKEHLEGNADHGKRIFLLTSLELWARRFGVEV